MGHRANFVVIRDGQATAYYDQWAARGCICMLADGPEAACNALAEYEETNELMAWCDAEGGYLVDFDEAHVIVFGYAIDPAEFADEDGNVDESLREEYLPFAETGLPYLENIRDQWTGWKLVWDDHGTDAFSAHLRSRGIKDLVLQPDSHPPTTKQPVELQA